MNHNFKIPNGDTDSITFCREDGLPFSDEEIKALLKELNDKSPDFMDWEDDGYYLCVIVLKAKNYILQFKDSKIKLKGSSLVDSKKEPALKSFMKEIIDVLLEPDE